MAQSLPVGGNSCLSDQQAELLRWHAAEQRLYRHVGEAGKWSIENYWIPAGCNRSVFDYPTPARMPMRNETRPAPPR
jgi:hypothetical protein